MNIHIVRWRDNKDHVHEISTENIDTLSSLICNFDKSKHVKYWKLGRSVKPSHFGWCDVSWDKRIECDDTFFPENNNVGETL